MDSLIMDAQQTKRLQACVQEISEILYQNTPSEELTTLEGYGVHTSPSSMGLRIFSPLMPLIIGGSIDQGFVSPDCPLIPNPSPRGRSDYLESQGNHVN